MEDNYRHQLAITERMRDQRMLNGTYKVIRNNEKGSEEFSVEIFNGFYKDVKRGTGSNIEGFFFDDRNKAVVFSRKSGELVIVDSKTDTVIFSRKDNKESTHLVCSLTKENEDYMSGTENGSPISFTRISKEVSGIEADAVLGEMDRKSK
jgi:hypothetical protein